MNSLEILDKKNSIKQRMTEIVELCKKEVRMMTEDEKTEFDNLKSDILELNSNLETLKRSLEVYDEELRMAETVKVNEVIEQPVIEEINTRNNNLNETKTMKEIRLLSAINAIANNRNLDENAQEFVKRGAEEMKKAGLSYTGQIQIPVENRAAITVTDTNSGTVDVDTMTMLDAIRGKNILAQAGAKFLTGLRGDVQIPVLTGAQVNWEGETDATADGNSSIASVKMQPKRLSCYIDISKQFLTQDSASAEAVLRQDLINAINSKLESTILGTGAGSATEPKGLFTGSVTLTDTFAKLVNAEAAIDGTNLGSPVYILSNAAKAKFRQTPKIAVTATGTSASATVSAGTVYSNGEIDGVPAYNSSNVAANMFAFGDFSNLCIAQWGAIN